MRNERLSNVHPGWVAIGFLVAVAVTAGVHLSLVATGFVPAGVAEEIANFVAVLLGFFAGGVFVGMRWSDAPVLNGAAIVLLSALVWFGASLAGSNFLTAHLRLGGAALTLGSLVCQLAGAVTGALTGRSMVRTGHVPEPDSMPPEA